MFSIAIGITKWTLWQYRTSSTGRAAFDAGGATYFGAEKWIREVLCATRPGLAKVLEMRSMVFLALALHGAIRGGCFRFSRSLHTHLLEFACAVGGDKYRTILESFLVTERTCPDMDLLSMISAWKVHCGSFYGARDEYQEFCHLMLAKHLVHSPGLSWKLNCALSEFPPWIYIIIFYSKHSR